MMDIEKSGAQIKNIPIALQLYSVSDLAAADLPATLAAIKQMGYDGVEFAGYYGRTAGELRQLLDDNGLKCAGSHLKGLLSIMFGGRFEQTVEFNQTIGNKFLIVPMLWSVFTIKGWIRAAARLTEIAEKLRPYGMFIGFHNHIREFRSINGRLPIEILFDNAGKDVVMQLDIGHCVHAGADPVVYLNKYPGRVRCVHIKEFSPAKKQYVIGEGRVNWPDVLRTCRSSGAIEWYIIEEETGAFEGLEGIEKCLHGLKNLLAQVDA